MDLPLSLCHFSFSNLSQGGGHIVFRISTAFLAWLVSNMMRFFVLFRTRMGNVGFGLALSHMGWDWEENPHDLHLGKQELEIGSLWVW